MALSKYVEQKNRWNAIFGKTELNVRNAEDRKRIAEMIDCDLSPENLTCDGELRGTALRQRQAFLVKAAQDLYRLDPTVRFEMLVN